MRQKKEVKSLLSGRLIQILRSQLNSSCTHVYTNSPKFDLPPFYVAYLILMYTRVLQKTSDNISLCAHRVESYYDISAGTHSTRVIHYEISLCAHRVESYYDISAGTYSTRVIHYEICEESSISHIELTLLYVHIEICYVKNRPYPILSWLYSMCT